MITISKKLSKGYTFWANKSELSTPTERLSMFVSMKQGRIEENII